MDYLAYDLKFKRTNLDAIKSSLRFLLSITPNDIPLNSAYGVTVPTDIKVADFTEHYKENLISMLKKSGFDLKVEDVRIEGKLLKVDIKYNNNSIETWDLTL